MQKHLAPFITIEGVDGAGKSSHVSTILQALEAAGFEVVATREPGGTELGSKLRAQLKQVEMSQQTAALIAFADRAEHLAQKIRPALMQGKAVLSDRFTDSTYAYQGGGDGCDWSQIRILENMVHADCQPDLTLFFDLPTEVAELRRERRKAELNKTDMDKFDEKSIEWFDRVRNAYLTRVEETPGRFSVVDASGTMEQVADNVKAAISEFIERWPAVRAAREKAVRDVESFVSSESPTLAQAKKAFIGFLQCQAKPLGFEDALSSFRTLRNEFAATERAYSSAELKSAALEAVSRGDLFLHTPSWEVGATPSRPRQARP